MRAHSLLAVLVISSSLAHAQNAQISARVTDAQGKPVADAVVVAVPSDGNVKLPARPPQDVVDQVDKEFVPKVQAILVGTAVTFPNRDSVRHQVYSFSPARRFELPLYTGVPQAVTFDKPGVVVLGCNIHDWMVGYIYVSESPYFAKTNAEGKAVLADLPPARTSSAYGTRSFPSPKTPRARTSTPRAPGATMSRGRSSSSRK